MFESKTTKIVKIRKKNIGSFLAMLFCTLVVVSTIGNSFAIRNSFAQVQQQPQTQEPSLTYNSPWSNNPQTLCDHGMCNPSSDPTSIPYSGILPIADPGNT